MVTWSPPRHWFRRATRSSTQKLGEPADEGFSIVMWASAGGTISSIEDDVIAIEGGGPSQQEAETEAEARR
jgi:Na+-translocating ferredoxin:NAD+ oxidoreductase subunit C